MKRGELYAMSGMVQSYRGPTCGSASCRQQLVGVFGTERRSDGPQIMGPGHTCEFVHRRKDWLDRHDPSAGWHSDLAEKSRKLALSCTSRMRASYYRRRPGNVCGTPRGMDTQCPAPTTISSSPQRTTIWPSRMYQVSSRSSWMCSGGAAPTGGHLEHDGVHFGRGAVLNDQGVEEPPGQALFALGGVDNCRRHFGHLLVRNCRESDSQVS